MAHRRRLTGQPLLVATGAAGLAVSVGCGGHEPPTGNLMPPPTVQGEICVDRVPAEAVVTVDGAVVDPHCATIDRYEGQVLTVHVSARGFIPQDQHVTMAEKMALQVVLDAAPFPEPPYPVGNLVEPPPMDRPKTP